MRARSHCSQKRWEITNTGAGTPAAGNLLRPAKRGSVISALVFDESIQQWHLAWQDFLARRLQRHPFHFVDFRERSSATASRVLHRCRVPVPLWCRWPSCVSSADGRCAPVAYEGGAPGFRGAGGG